MCSARPPALSPRTGPRPQPRGMPPEACQAEGPVCCPVCCLAFRSDPGFPPTLAVSVGVHASPYRRLGAAGDVHPHGSLERSYSPGAAPGEEDSAVHLPLFLSPPSSTSFPQIYCY